MTIQQQVVLDHPRIQQATAAVMANGQVRGTAWLFADGLALTAAHVVGDLEDGVITTPRVKLVFPTGAAAATQCH